MLTYVVFFFSAGSSLIRPNLHWVTHFLNLNVRHIYNRRNKTLCSWLIIWYTAYRGDIGKLPPNGNRWAFIVLFNGCHVWSCKWFSINQNILIAFCFVLEQLTQAVHLCEIAQHVLPSDLCVEGEWRDASVPDSPSHPSQSALAGFGMAGTPSQQWRSCESTLRTQTHTGTKHTLGNKTRTIPQSRGLCIPNYSSDMETLQSRKHLHCPPSLTCQH